MPIAEFPLGPLDTNCFVIHNGKDAVAVDPGGPPGRVLDYLKEQSLTLTHILLTHLHFDHTYGVAELARVTGARAFGSEKDAYMLENEFGLGGVWGLPEVEPYTFEPLESGDLSLPCGPCTVLATPGHTPGGLSFYFPDIAAVCAGDALFRRSVGRTDFPRGSFETLAASIRTGLFTLPEETAVYCGHGPATQIGDEKRNNPFVSDFSAA